MISQFPVLSIKNEQLVKQSQKVGCYHCCKVFESSEIKEFTDNGKTCLCPYCKVDSIIGEIFDLQSSSFKLTEELLKQANKVLF